VKHSSRPYPCAITRSGGTIIIWHFVRKPPTRSVRFPITGAFAMANNSPEKVFRIGLVNASVFKNVIEPREQGGQKRTIRSVNLQRRYQDDEDK
jgi:hypothetical protein